MRCVRARRQFAVRRGAQNGHTKYTTAVTRKRSRRHLGNVPPGHARMELVKSRFCWSVVS